MNQGSRNSWKRWTLSRRWVCTLLVLVTWRGPVPLVHAHADHIPRTVSDEELNLSLISHLQRFHRGITTIPAQDLHIHLVFPWSTPGPESPSPGDPAEDPLVCSGVRVLQTDSETCITSLNLGDAFWLQQSSHTQVHVQNSFPAPTRLFSSTLSERLSKAPLCAVVGVALC